MGLEKPYNGAFQEVESVNKPKNGAWEECEVVNKPKNGAWAEVWSAIKFLIELSNSLDKGYLDIQDEGVKFYYSKSDDISGTGTIIFYVEGAWVDPVISFDYEGYYYRTNATETMWYTGSAGCISLYGRTADGTETTEKVVSSVGRSESGSLETGDGWAEEGKYSGVLEGSFDRVGIVIDITGYSSVSEYYNAFLNMIVSNLLINDRKTAFPISSEFDYE